MTIVLFKLNEVWYSVKSTIWNIFLIFSSKAYFLSPAVYPPYIYTLGVGVSFTHTHTHTHTQIFSQVFSEAIPFFSPFPKLLLKVEFPMSLILEQFSHTTLNGISLHHSNSSVIYPVLSIHLHINFFHLSLIQKILCRDSPGSPVVRTSHSNVGSAYLIPGEGSKIPHAS